MMDYHAVITDKSITIIGNSGVPYVVSSSHPNFVKVKTGIINEMKFPELEKLFDLVKTINNTSKGKVTIVDGEVHYQGKVTSGGISKRIVDTLYQKGDVSHMVLFLEHLMENPSYRAVNELYGWMEKSALGITDDGCLLAYKYVNSNFTSCHPNKDGSHNMNDIMNHTPVVMERNDVCDDSKITCAEGLHFCSLDYVKHEFNTSGHKVIVVKINPKDVVSIPTDYGCTKGRCCGYIPMEEIFGEVAKDSDMGQAVVETGNIVTMEEVIAQLGIQNLTDVRGALRKRIKAGKSVKAGANEGEYILLIKPVLDVVTKEKAMVRLGIDTGALRKRLGRKASVRPVMVLGKELVEFVPEEVSK
jgi:hypothetical protein